MATILIKKKIVLDFLGDEHKEDFLVFKSLSLSEYEGLLDKLESVAEDGKKSIKLILEILENQYVEGKFGTETVTKEDLKQFDLPTITRCFELFTGRETSPKVE